MSSKPATAMTQLTELCRMRGYGSISFAGVKDGPSGPIVCVSAEGRKDGSQGTGSTFQLACEAAAAFTLAAWTVVSTSPAEGDNANSMGEIVTGMKRKAHAMETPEDNSRSQGETRQCEHISINSNTALGNPPSTPANKVAKIEVEAEATAASLYSNADPIASAMVEVAKMPKFQNVVSGEGAVSGTSSGIAIRRAVESDAGDLLRLITELAIFEKEPNAVQITEETLKKDGWGGQGTQNTSPRFYSFLAVEKCTGSPDLAVGMALFSPNYSTWQGLTCYLEDLVVSESFRGRGIGGALIEAIGNVCLRTGMSRLSWQCLNWNQKSLDFYSELGAVQMPEWVNLRMSQDAMQKKFGAKENKNSVEVTVLTTISKHSVDKKNSVPPAGSASSWATAFIVAEKAGSVLDDDIADFLEKKQGRSDSPVSDCNHNSNVKPDGTVACDADAGGFNQPRSLADFVNEWTSSGDDKHK